MRKLKYSIGIISAIIIILLIFYSIVILLSLKRGSVNINNSTDNTTDNYSTDGQNQRELIVLFSLDGMGSDLITSETPYLFSLTQRSDSSSFLDMQTLKQSETLPANLSMLTGLTQEHHGLYTNNVDSNTSKLNQKTLFDYASDEGFSYYAFFTKEKLLYIVGDKVGDNILFLDGLSGDVIEDIDSLVETKNDKVFVFIHLRDIDTVGHSSGWGSFIQKQALKSLDGNLELLMTDFESEFSNYQRYFIFTADHGGEGFQHANGCVSCRRIPLIVISENAGLKYVLAHDTYNIYDVTCVVLDLMYVTDNKDLDCRQ